MNYYMLMYILLYLKHYALKIKCLGAEYSRKEGEGFIAMVTAHGNFVMCFFFF